MEKKPARTQLERELKAAADPVRAEHSVGYFRTGKGQYGEGDIFLGISVPVLRKIALKHRGLAMADLQKLLESKIHEHRAAALEILVVQYERGDEKLREEIVEFYLRNTSYINNWDLVDGSAGPILGHHLKTHPRKILKKLAKSKSLWERRIAMISTMTLVWAGELDDALQIAEMLLDDEHDLIHKAVGWVLREAGRKDRKRLVAFLKAHYARLPRTALRYAIEHFSAEQRKKMLAGEFDPVN
jgi:3-methyladenine DNA glycosylase AlkD